MGCQPQGLELPKIILVTLNKDRFNLSIDSHTPKSWGSKEKGGEVSTGITPPSLLPEEAM